MSVATFQQVTHRIRDDDGNETGATWLAAQGADYSMDVDVNFRVRFLVDETTGSKAWSNNAFNLYYSLNGGGYNPIDNTTPIQYSTSTEFTDGDDCTQQLTGGSGTFVTDNNGMSDTDAQVTNSGSAGQLFECEFCLTIDSAQVANGNTIELRVYNGTSAFGSGYSDTPVITVVEISTLTIDVNDGITIGETKDAVVGTPQISTTETLIITDTPTASLPLSVLEININENINVADNLIDVILVLQLNISETITATDNITALLTATLIGGEHAEGNGSQTTTGFDTTGADLLIAVICTYSSTSMSGVSDSKGNSWTFGTTYGSGTFFVTVGYAENPTVGAGHTLTNSASDFQVIFFYAFSGMKISSVYDTENGASDAENTGNITPSGINELLITAFCADTGSGDSSTVDGDFVIEDLIPFNAGVNPGAGVAFNNTYNSVTPVSCTWTDVSYTNGNGISITAFVLATGAEVKNLSVNDGITVAETISANISTLEINISESINVADNSIISISDLSILITDAANIIDVPTIFQSNFAFSTFETVTISENEILAVSDPQINTNENILVEDVPNISTAAPGTLAISIFETINITDTLTIETTENLIIADAITIADIPTVNVGVAAGLEINVSDSIFLAENSILVTSSPQIDINDPVTIADLPTVNVGVAGALSISVTSGILINDSPSSSISTAEIIISDGINLSDDPNPLVINFINVSESLNVADIVAIMLEAYAISINENITISEAIATFGSGDLSIFINENIAVLDLIFTSSAFSGVGNVPIIYANNKRLISADLNDETIKAKLKKVIKYKQR